MKKKIYGEYPGSLSKIEEVDNYSEYELFLTITSLECCILQYKRIQAYNMSISIDTAEDEYALEYLINKTSKFGVEIEKDEQGRIIKTGDYMGWYEYHIKHFDSTLGKEHLGEFLELRKQGQDISKYFPTETYLEYKTKMSKDIKIKQMRNAS